jgi:hypothetical protein
MSTAPQEIVHSAPESRQAIVLCADMLGFSAMVRKAKTMHDAIELAGQLARFAEQFSGKDYEDAATQAFYSKKYWGFSDAIVVCWYAGSNAEATMTEFDAQLDQLSGIALAQSLMMWDHKQLVRGGVGHGWMLEHGTTVVGEALVAAASIEKHIEMPFIGVETSLYERYLKHPGRNFYAESIDPTRTLFVPPCSYTKNYPALDYFMIMLGEIDITPSQMVQAKGLPVGDAREEFREKCFWENRKMYVRWHRDFVTSGLAHHDERVRIKFEALKQHHNFRTQPLYPTDPSMLIH